MANENVTNPFGLRPVRTLDGRGLVKMNCAVPAADGTRLGIGDPVKLADTGAATVVGDRAVPTVTRAAAGDPIFGVVQGVYYSTIESTTYRTASVLTGVVVTLAAGVVFQIQEDSVGGALALTNGNNVGDIVVADCSTTTGASQVMLDSSTVTTGGAAQLLVLGLATYGANGTNKLGDYAVWEVIVNESHLYGNFAGV